MPAAVSVRGVQWSRIPDHPRRDPADAPSAASGEMFAEALALQTGQ
jgi:hypothetical protein